MTTSSVVGTVMLDTKRINRHVLMFVLIVLLISCTNATEVNEILGPYKVSFSLPVDIKTNKSVDYGESYGGIEYTFFNLGLYNTTNDSKMGSLWIVDYNSTISTDFVNLSDSFKTFLKNIGYTEARDYSRMIDGRHGVLVEGDGALSFPQAFWWLYYFDNHALVSGYSLLPWNEGTLQLLKTIHVEKINETAK